MATTVGDGGPAHVSSDPRRSDCMFRHGITSPIVVNNPGQTNYIPSNSGQIDGLNWDKIENFISNVLDDILARKLPDYSMPICWHNQPPYLPLNGEFGTQYPTFPYPMQPYNQAYPGQYNHYNIPQNMANGYSNGAHFIQNNIAPQIKENKPDDYHLQSNIIVNKDRPIHLLGQSNYNNNMENYYYKYRDETNKVLQEMRNNFNDSAEELKEVLHDAIYDAFYPDSNSDASDADSDSDYSDAEFDTQENCPMILASPNDDEEELMKDQSMVNSEVGHNDMAYYWEEPDTEGYTEKDAESFYSEINPLASDDFDAHYTPSFSTTGLRRWTALRRIGN